MESVLCNFQPLILIRVIFGLFISSLNIPSSSFLQKAEENLPLYPVSNEEAEKCTPFPSRVPGSPSNPLHGQS